jgi:hypothetical protein
MGLTSGSPTASNQQGETTMKGLIIEIYHSKYDATNGGVTATADEALLVGDGIPQIFDDDGTRPVLKVVERVFFGEVYRHLEPVEPVKRGNVGYMYGGNIGYTSDSRFPGDYPLKIHDRQETQHQNDILSQ